MCECWEDVVEYEGLYQISDLGNIRRHPDKQSKNKYRKPKPLARAMYINRLGYYYTTLSKNGKTQNKTIHQLVAAAFIPKFEYGMPVNHIDGDKKNNSIENLEKTTYQYNNLHAHKNGLVSKPGKSKYHNVHIRYSKYKHSVYTEYYASVKDNNKVVFCKYCATELEAAHAVDEFLDSINDTCRNRNFPKSLKSQTTISKESTP
jgi:hypothetical protein